MKKSFRLCIIILLLAVVFSSCKRRWQCVCRITGSQDTTTYKEYWGYKKDEAQRVCESDNYASFTGTEIDCNVK